MLIVQDSIVQKMQTTLIASLAVLLAVFCLNPTAAPAQAKDVPPASASGSDAGQAACAAVGSEAVPVNTTIRAKVTNTIDAAHLKPGKKIWVNAQYGMVYPECRLEPDAAIYGTVTAASASKNPSASELSIEFNSADCSGHRQPLKLLLVGIVAPPDQLKNSHDAMPTELQGSARQISDTAGATDGYDARLNPGGAPNTVRPGVVVGYKNLKLEPQGGPQCSAKMTSIDRNIELAQGAVLLLAIAETK